MKERLVHAGSSPGSESRAFVEGVGTVVLVAVVAAMLLMFILLLIAFGLHRALSVTLRYPDRDGIELVAFPLAALAGAILRHRVSSIRALRARSIGPWLPLLAACAFAVLACILMWSWSWAGEGRWYGPERWYGPDRLFGAAALASVAFLTTVLFPRISAVLSGAIAAPALFAVIVFLFQDSLVPGPGYYGPSSPGDRWLLHWLLPAAPVMSAALVGACVLLRPRVISHAAWGGALTLPFAMLGYLAGINAQ